MRRLAILLVVVIVNLPWAHETWTDHRLADDGVDVTATVTATRAVGGRRFVVYRLPRAVDRSGTAYTARVDDAHYLVARESKQLAVRVLPGSTSAQRPEGEVTGPLFGVVAILGDLMLLFVLAGVIWRRRRWRGRVLAVDGDLVTFELGPMRLTARCSGRVPQVGDVLPGRLRLEADRDVVPGLPLGEIEPVGGAAHLVRGRVTDVAREYADLQLDNGYVLRVLVGPHRNRADLRETAEVSGTLVLGPEPSLRP